MLNKGVVLVMDQEEFDAIKREWAIMQQEVLQGGPWDTTVKILGTIINCAVDTDLDVFDDPTPNMIGVANQGE